jgi:hypothetical protein
MNQPAPKSGEPAGSAAFQRAREGYWGEVYRFLYPEPMGQVEQVGEAEALHQDFAARARRTLAVPDDSRINGLASAFPSDAGEVPAVHAQPQQIVIGIHIRGDLITRQRRQLVGNHGRHNVLVGRTAHINRTIEHGL